MKRRSVLSGKIRLLICGVLLTLTTFASAAKTDNSPPPGGYCPGRDILYITAEGLSASLNLTMESRAALVAKDRSTALNDLRELGTTLNLAASRGAAARTALLIDSVIEAKSGEDYTQLLDWLPLLKSSLFALPDDMIVRSAGDSLTSAEAIMRGDEQGDALEALKTARHMIACDGLDIPLKDAMREQGDLMKGFDDSKSPKVRDYDTLLHDLRDALDFALANKQMAAAD